jgi:hypothetical protein
MCSPPLSFLMLFNSVTLKSWLFICSNYFVIAPKEYFHSLHGYSFFFAPAFFTLKLRGKGMLFISIG